jgi:hypothetical protein
MTQMRAKSFKLIAVTIKSLKASPGVKGLDRAALEHVAVKFADALETVEGFDRGRFLRECLL